MKVKVDGGGEGWGCGCGDRCSGDGILRGALVVGTSNYKITQP